MAMKSSWVGVRTQASINALTVPEASAGCSGVSGEAPKAPRMLSGCPPATAQLSAPRPPVHTTQYSTRSVTTSAPPLQQPKPKPTLQNYAHESGHPTTEHSSAPDRPTTTQ